MPDMADVEDALVTVVLHASESEPMTGAITYIHPSSLDVNLRGKMSVDLSTVHERLVLTKISFGNKVLSFEHSQVLPLFELPPL